MEKFKYHILVYSDDPKYCEVDEDAEGVEDEWNLSEGVKMGSSFPADASYHLSKDSKGTKLSDFLVNTINLLMISQKVKDLMGQEEISNVEFLPFTLYDKKGRIINRKYFIANVLGTIDCLDLDNSIYTRSALDPDRIMIFEKVVLHTGKIPKDRKLFRLKERPTLHIIRSDFAEVLAQNNVTGMALLHLGEDIII